MLSLEQAIEKLLQSVKPIEGDQAVSIGDAIGRVVAEDVLAPSALPSFDNSAMDGWAVRSADVQGASADRLVTLECIANVPAGKSFGGTIGAGQCARIFTGSPLPAGADAVVMQEDTHAELPKVHILDAVKPWENIRFRGEDVKEGSLIARRGDRVTPQTAALLSACGVSQVRAKRRLRVAVLATGNELKEPGAKLAPGEIYESNRILIASLLSRLGMDPVVKPIVTDELAATVNAIREASECDAVVTCGGVSVGEYDFVKAAIGELGGAIDFWRVAIKPGKPFVHAHVSGKSLFGLPGNPVSALVTFWMLVRPALLRMAGANDVSARISLGVSAEEIRNPGDRRHFVRVTIDGEGNVRASGPQASHRLASLAAANGLVDVAAGETWPAGKTVKVILLD
jgi:molybdopterin molybdotransferase